ncbi:MAG: divalent-cation tolerance protein CutA [Desulfobacterales bacterium]|nr:divalent-cation tolerance protein CutA [Desulfobacterales bacterium]
MSYCMILVTCSDESGAGKLASDLVENRLAACVQIHSVTSIYSWENQVHRDPEFRLMIKTRSSLYRDVEAFIIERHSYEVPQIIQVPVESGLTAYLNWIDDNTK